MLRQRFIHIVLFMSLLAVASLTLAAETTEMPLLDRQQPESTETTLFALG